MENLLTETLSELSLHNKKESDIRWVGTRSHKITWENFKECADIEYDDSSSIQEVAHDLVIVGDGWWLERYEWDNYGSEAWRFVKVPVEPDETLHVDSLTRDQAVRLGRDLSYFESHDLEALNGIK
jgi:hypothetical protein